MNALYIKDLRKSYKDFTLKDINLTLPNGCIMGFIGENGAGKSTTIKSILDIVHPDSGEVKIMGEPLSSKLKEDIGVVIDEVDFPESITVKSVNLMMKNIYKNWNEKEYDKLIKDFDLPENKPFKEYSKGMKMKLNIAVALSHNAKILILDEPTSGLDPIVRDEILDVFLDFIQDENHSIFISSHITSDLEKICDYIAFIHKGELIFSEEKDKLHEKYGILKCSEDELSKIDASIIKGKRKSNFGVEALVIKEKITGNYTIDNASLEDIMVFMVKKERR